MMLDKDTLEERCRNLFMEGEEFVLNNGAKVLIPSMPVGSISKPFMRIKDKLSEPKQKQKKVDGKLVTKTITKTVDGVQFTEDTPVMVDNPDFIDFDSQAGMEVAGKILHKILSLNYELTEDESDGLFSMTHFGEVLTFFFTGQRDNLFKPGSTAEVASGPGSAASPYEDPLAGRGARNCSSNDLALGSDNSPGEQLHAGEPEPDRISTGHPHLHRPGKYVQGDADRGIRGRCSRTRGKI